VQGARASLAGDFDGVFSTWGTICWMPDLDQWAGIVTSLLRPDGWLYLAEGHPYAFANAFPEDPYGASTMMVEDEPGDYMDRGAERTHTRTVDFSHGLGQIVSAVAGAGLQLDWLHEHDAVVWDLSRDLVRGDDRLWRRPGSDRPLSFSLRATKPGTR
jgi:hypothetical protein